MKYYLYIKTIAEKAEYVNKEFFIKVSQKTKIDTFTIKQRFIGKGFAVLYDSFDFEKVKYIRDALKTLNIQSYIIDEKQLLNLNYYSVKSIVEYDNKYKCILNNNKIINVNKKDNILIVYGVDNRKYNNIKLNTFLLSDNFICFLYFKNQNILLKITLGKTNLSGIKNSNNFSHSQNFLTLFNTVKNNSEHYTIDKYYSLNYIPNLGKSIEYYALISIKLFLSGYYDFSYDKSVFSNMSLNKNHKEIKFDSNVHYKVYSAHNKLLKKSLLNFTSINIAVIFPIVFFIFSFILTEGNYTPFIYAIGFLYLSIILFKYFKLKLFIEDIPTSKISSLSIGLREIKGRVLEHNSMPSYVSGTKSVFFRYYKYRKVRRDNKVQWVLDKIGEYCPDTFYIEEDGYILQIKTKNACFDLSNRTKYTKPYFLFDSDYYDKDVYYIEEVLPVYADVYILGTVVNVDLKEEYNSFLREKKNNWNFMKQFDKDNNKRIDIEEWDNAKGEIDKLFYEQLNKKFQNELLKVEFNSDDKLLFISDSSEKDIIKKLNIYLIFMIVLEIITIVLFLRSIL